MVRAALTARRPAPSPDPTSWREPAYELHRARRFYDRPESRSSRSTASDPTPSAAGAVARAQGEFHERVTKVGDHPELLRRLGLVIDLAVDDVERLGGPGG